MPEPRPIDPAARTGRNELVLRPASNAYALARFEDGAWLCGGRPLDFEPTEYLPREPSQ